MQIERSAIEYRRLVARLLVDHPRNEAMSLAVGGSYDAAGDAEFSLLAELGIGGAGTSLIDLGCGSGRLAAVLSGKTGNAIEYLGVDVVPALLDYARERSCPSYRFAISDGAGIPAADSSASAVVAFSLFTHLRRRERLSYMHEIGRVLRPSGRFVVSFLEPWSHRRHVLATIRARLRGSLPHHNAFAFSWNVAMWGRQDGLRLEMMLPNRIGQSVAVFRKAE